MPSSVLSKSIKIATYRTIILLVILYGCGSWSLILMEKCRLRWFESDVMRGMFGSKRYDVTADWEKLHNEELYELYFSPNIIE